MRQETKILIGIAVVSIAILGAAVYFLGKQPSASTQTVNADPAVLVRSDSNKLIASESAKVTLVEFGDYQCPACAAAQPIAKKILEDYKGQINFVFRNFPLVQHKNGKISARAAEAAGVQNKYWEMNDLLYKKQSDWAEVSNPEDKFISYAQEIGLNIEQFRQDLRSNKFDEKISKDIADGTSLGVDSTPTFYINNQKTVGYSYNEFKTTIESLLNK